MKTRTLIIALIAAAILGGVNYYNDNKSFRLQVVLTSDRVWPLGEARYCTFDESEQIDCF